MTQSLGLSEPPAREPTIVGRTFRSLRRRNYRLWFIGQTVSMSGTWMQSAAQGWLVYTLTHSGFDLGITVALQFAPVLVFGTVGGLVADRVDKRKALLVTQSAFLLQSAALGALVLTGAARLWIVWALALVYGFINVVDNPTRQSFVFEIVGSEDLVNAVALNSVIMNGSRIVGLALAGVLILAAGIGWAFMINAVTFLAVIVALSVMRTAELHRTTPLRRATGQIRAGLRYAWRTWELRVPLLLMAVVGTLAYNFSVIMPLLAGKVFHRGAGTYSALLVAFAVGALGGGLFTASRRRPGYRLLVLVTLAFGVFNVALAVAPSLAVALAVLVPMGAAGISFIAVGNSLLQLHSTSAMRGRVMALWAIVFLGSTPIGGPLTGLMAAHLGTRVTLAFGGAVTILAGAGGALAMRRIRGAAGRRSGEPLPCEALASACSAGGDPAASASAAGR